MTFQKLVFKRLSKRVLVHKLTPTQEGKGETKEKGRQIQIGRRLFL